MLVYRRLASVLVIISMAILLPGCTAGIIAMQAIPAVIGGGAIAGARDRSPFEIPVGPIKSEESMNLAMLDEHIRKADCGDALSQFQLGMALENQFNNSPNLVAIYSWYWLAEMGGIELAMDKRKAITLKMSALQVLEAKSQAQSWRANSDGC